MLKVYILLICLIACQYLSLAQNLNVHNGQDTVFVADTIAGMKARNALESKVDYVADDSIMFDLKIHKAFLYRNSEIYYEDIDLKADYVEINFISNTVFATGLVDTTGALTGKPVFTQKDNSFSSREMRYNYRTKKGIVHTVITQDGEGYIHGKNVKYMPNKDVNIRHGKYTTCSLEHPHFEFRFSKAKVIPGNKIVTGPAFIVIEDVPTPLFVPFGLFPNKKGQRSGIVIPTYGEAAKRGFYFENGGYYFAINDYLDLKLTGDIYTLGSWALKPQTNYRKRYKYSGSMNFGLAENVLGEPGSPDFEKKKDFEFRWIHNQDPKARPNSRFSANVNIVSSKFNKYNPVSSNQYLSNTFQSSINYSTNFGGKYFLTGALNHQQNTITREVNLTLPKFTFSVNRFYPLRKKVMHGKPKWHENISVNYSSTAENRINTYDTLLFKERLADKMKNGMKHDISVSSGSFKLLKHIMWTNNLNFTERWYSQTIRKNWSSGVEDEFGQLSVNQVITDTVYGFQAARDYSISTSLSSTMYGMFQYRRGPVNALRHVMKPSLSFSFHPDFSNPAYGYYKYFLDNAGKKTQYSIFEQGIYGTPAGRKSGNIGFRLSNNLEMKVRSLNDTITGTKKIVLIEDLSFAISYDIAKDSLNLSPLAVTGRTTLFNNLSINYSGVYDPYALDASGKRINTFEWDVNKKLFRPDRHSWRLGLNYRLNSDMIHKERHSETGTDQELTDVLNNIEGYVDWSIPWSLNFSYDLNYTNKITYKNGYRDYEIEKNKSLIQTISFSGELNITKKWKVGFRSGYDFESANFSYTSIDVYRDLHCWQMSFNWIPYGFRQSWNFTINIKSSLLQDLKLDKKKDFRDF